MLEKKHLLALCVLLWDSMHESVFSWRCGMPWSTSSVCEFGLALLLLISLAPPRLGFCKAARSLALKWQKPLIQREIASDGRLLCGANAIFFWRNVKVHRTDFWPSTEVIYIQLECQICRACAPVPLLVPSCASWALRIRYEMSLWQDQDGNEKRIWIWGVNVCPVLVYFRSCHHQGAEGTNKGNGWQKSRQKVSIKECSHALRGWIPKKCSTLLLNWSTFDAYHDNISQIKKVNVPLMLMKIKQTEH